jgi:hypothetical protein
MHLERIAAMTIGGDTYFGTPQLPGAQSTAQDANFAPRQCAPGFNGFDMGLAVYVEYSHLLGHSHLQGIAHLELLRLCL